MRSWGLTVRENRTEGSAKLLGEELLEMEPEARAAAGLFLAFQYPVEIPGVGNMTFLRTALNAQRKARGEEEVSAGDFLKLVREKAKALKIDADMLKRPVNVGFSGGEKKRNEILQMAMLEPKMCILDETDSGLDVDAMKLVSDGVNALRDAGRSFLVITHYQRLLDHIKPDVVHIMAAGRIVKTGGKRIWSWTAIGDSTSPPKKALKVPRRWANFGAGLTNRSRWACRASAMSTGAIPTPPA
ncbi:MAG: putative ATP-dependent transporter SufC [Pseudomonadota bacterium]